MKLSNQPEFCLYHTLLVKEDGTWCIAFGDYDLDVVKQEARDDYEDATTRIITTSSDSQREIDGHIAALNANNATQAVKACTCSLCERE